MKELPKAEEKPLEERCISEHDLEALFKLKTTGVNLCRLSISDTPEQATAYGDTHGCQFLTSKIYYHPSDSPDRKYYCRCMYQDDGKIPLNPPKK